MLEIIVRIVVAGCLMVGSAHLPLYGLQTAPAAPAQGAVVHVDPPVASAL